MIPGSVFHGIVLAITCLFTLARTCVINDEMVAVCDFFLTFPLCLVSISLYKMYDMPDKDIYLFASTSIDSRKLHVCVIIAVGTIPKN